MKRFFGCLVALLLGAGLFCPAAFAQEQAQTLSPSIAMYGGGDTSRITDGNLNSKIECLGSTSFTIKSDEPITQLYIQLDQPAQWVLYSAGRTPKTQGVNGFLHEYIALDAPANLLVLTFPKGTKICEIYAFGAGETPEWVQKWQPPCQKADLLVLPTHADDEHLWFGGTMPYYAAEKGMAVQVAYLTNHWGEPYRPHELLNGLWTVGVKNYPVISDFPDLYASLESLESARSAYNEDAITAFQVELLRRFQPDVVVGHDIKGEYGHGAHILNATTLLQALEISADAETYPESADTYGTWQVKKCYLHLWPENQIEMQWSEMPLQAFGGKTALEMAEQGYACHQSQQGFWFAVKESGSYDCRKFGLAYTTVGLDEAKTDFFEHIPPNE